MWINRNIVKSGEGDAEAMTKDELKRFCSRGKISAIECITTDNVPHDQTEDANECTTQKGLVCEALLNFPVGCLDYKVRYQCEEEVCRTPTAHPPTVSGQTPSAGPQTGSEGTPSGRPTTDPNGSPTAHPPTVSGQTPSAGPQTGSGDDDRRCFLAFHTFSFQPETIIKNNLWFTR